MRLIDAEAEELINKINRNFGGVTRFAIKSILMDAPTIDATPVVHGRWKELRMEVLWRECPSCCNLFNGIGSADYNYCPYCGMKIDG